MRTSLRIITTVLFRSRASLHRWSNFSAWRVFQSDVPK